MFGKNTYSILDRNLDQRHLDIFSSEKFTVFVSIFYFTFSAIDAGDRINLIKIQVRTYELRCIKLFSCNFMGDFQVRG